MSRTWTIDELVDACERKGIIEPPFAPDERALAYSVAAAWHFGFWMQELPGRCPEDSRAYGSLLWGIERVNTRRTAPADRPGHELWPSGMGEPPIWTSPHPRS